MKTTALIKRYFRWLNVPTLSLLALLQRTPVVQVATTAEEFVLNSPIGALLKSAAATLASLGAINSLVGATPLVPSIGSDSGTSVATGTAVSIGFTVSPTQTPIVSWQIGGTVPPGLDFSGRTTPGIVNVGSLLLSGTPTAAGAYPVTIQAFDASNAGGFSSAIYTYTITVTGGTAAAPTITTQPSSQTVTVGSSVTFSVAATGSPAPTFQWRKDTTNIAGETGSSLSLTNVQTTAAGTYTVVATNSAGSVTSIGAVLTVNAAPAGAPSAPTSLGGFASSATEVTLSWLAPSGGNAVQGYKVERATDSAFGAGLTAFNLSTPSTFYVDTSASGNVTYFYRVSSTNTGGASAPATAVQVKTPGATGTGATRFANIATRASCGTGNNVTIGGFVVAGGAKKKVLIRAVGPSLTAQGISAAEALLDPVIEVHKGAPVIATNDDWGTNANAAEITATGTRIGAAALLGSDTKSSALLTELDPGVYSFVASGKGGTSGVVLLEVYDADDVVGGSTFSNIATRAFSTTGNGVTIGGFVISGGAPKQVLLRAMGPTLTTQGIGASEVLTDPTIELHQGAPVIAVNDNWGDNSNVAAMNTTGARIGATPFDASDRNSSAMLLKLQPGVYSFIARGKTSPSGIVLVEVYDAD
ncbi:MAG: immunoglobulin domain-containing protein [Opitutus sp.]